MKVAPAADCRRLAAEEVGDTEKGADSEKAADKSDDEVSKLCANDANAWIATDGFGDNSTSPSSAGQYGADEECVAKAVLAASHDDAGFSEDPSVSRSRSTSEDAGSDAAGTTRASLGYAQLQSSTHQMAGEQKQAKNFGAAPAASCDADADGLSGDDFDDIDEGGVMESDDGEDGDMEEDDEEEEEEMEDEQQQEAQEEPAQQTCCVADFDERKLEATTHWSKAHEARMCRVVETCFPGHGMICFERMYRTSRPVQEITRESLLLRDHILLPELVASKAKSSSRRMLSLCYNWTADDMHLVHVIWMDFLQPEVFQAQQRSAEGKWQDAFAHLLALQLFFDASDDKWLTDSPMETIPRLRQWLQVFAYLWRSVLSLNDFALGLYPQCGKHGGYRRRVLLMIEQWEARCNQVLQVRLDPLTGEEEALRVSIVTDITDRSAFASGLDTDWSYDDDNE